MLMMLMMKKGYRGPISSGKALWGCAIGADLD